MNTKKFELFFTFILIPVDLAMILLAFVLSYNLRTHFEIIPVQYVQPFIDYLKFIAPWLPLWIFIFALTGLYHGNRKSIWQEFGQAIVAISAAMALMMVWFFFQKVDFFSRLIIIYSWVLAILLVIIGRYLIKLVQRYLYLKNIGVHRVIVLGNNGSTKTLSNEIKENPGLGYKLAKVIDEEAIKYLASIVQKYPCDEIIIADTSLKESQVMKVMEFCRNNRLGFKMIPSLLLVQSSHMDVQQIAGLPVLEFKRTPLDGWGRIIKRLIDIILSIVLIIITSPFMLIVALLIKLTDRGPVFFKQERVGLDKNFTLLKFRSMKAEYCTGDNYGGEKAAKLRKELAKKMNEVDGPVFKIANDPRITSVGKFIRKTSLDELPQFFNVLKGEMSLIGPRPPLAEEVEKYTSWQKRRLGVKPGITGLWQVSGRSELSFDEWVKLDAYYIEHWSLWLDFQIFLRTIKVVFFRKGAY